LRPQAGSLPAELAFRLDFGLPCLRGQHRTVTASELLAPSNCWWIVKLYNEKLVRGVENDPVRAELAQHYTNQRPPADGEIYRQIQLCQGDAEQRRYWAMLTPSKQKYVEQFHKVPMLTQAVNQMLPLVGLWDGFLPRVLHKLRALHYEEVGT
jgi:hypothetical protein